MAIPQTEVSHLELSHTVCSVSQFLERLKGIRLSEDEVMVSFDVTSLSTSIPQCLSVKMVSELLECKYDETDESVKRTHLIQLLKVCLKTFFTFEGRVFEQTKGRRWDHRFQASSQKQFSKSQDRVKEALRLFPNALNVHYDVQFYISNLHFLNALLCLRSLSKIIKDGIIPGRSSSRTSLSPLFSWLLRFRNTLLAKFSLYWFNILQGVGPSEDLDYCLARESPDLVPRLRSFTSRPDVSYVSLFFDAQLQDFAYLGHSYVAPVAVGNPPTGVESLPPILTIPPVRVFIYTTPPLYLFTPPPIL
nr:unnamed protein product [Spirometra erinaceieuropaei]